MLQITLKKSKSANYKYAVDMMLQLGASPGNGGVILTIPEHELLNAYNSLFQLVELIGQWKGVSATFKGNKVNLYRFIFLVYINVAECGSEKTNSKEKNFCIQKYDIPNWGCRLIESLLLYNTGGGNYERSGIYWYNYGFFDNSGMWIIDKDRIYARVQKEIQKKSLDICPYFDIALIEKIIFRDLPDYIVPDNYNYRLHYEKVYEEGNEILKAVNIRHVSDPSKVQSKQIVREIKNINDFFKVVAPDMPEKLKRKFKKDTIQKGSAITKAFNKDGICQN